MKRNLGGFSKAARVTPSFISFLTSLSPCGDSFPRLPLRWEFFALDLTALFENEYVPCDPAVVSPGTHPSDPLFVSENHGRGCSVLYGLQ